MVQPETASDSQLGDAERQWWRAVEEVPTYRIAWRALGDNLLRQGRLDAAAALAVRLEQKAELKADALMLPGQVAAARGRFQQARDLFWAAACQDPDDLAPLRALCQHVFHYGDPAESEQMLLRLADKDPLDGAIHHNLGTLYLRTGRLPEAVRS